MQRIDVGNRSDQPATSAAQPCGWDNIMTSKFGYKSKSYSNSNKQFFKEDKVFIKKLSDYIRCQKNMIPAKY